jgi:hypothetical protein
MLLMLLLLLLLLLQLAQQSVMRFADGRLTTHVIRRMTTQRQLSSAGEFGNIRLCSKYSMQGDALSRGTPFCGR